jgi:hypothetical protein
MHLLLLRDKQMARTKCAAAVQIRRAGLRIAKQIGVSGQISRVNGSWEQPRGELVSVGAAIVVVGFPPVFGFD